MLLVVEEADYLNNYKIYVKFNDGTEGQVDLEKTIFSDNRQIFKELRNKEIFKNFKIALNTVCWSNDLDLAPEYIKEKISEQ
ncbi:MAG: DUF2442 domain-containing protein [Spirochaetota bacterium]|nr:DUF2442 domain-containing protein [Spirochaetota bacterium]